MSLEKINLRKLLQIFAADARKQRSLLLADIRNDRTKQSRESGKGGDFYTPFWAAVKRHATGGSNFVEEIDICIGKNRTRRHLYPVLRDGFLEMWNKKMRWRNEPFQFVPQSIKAQLSIKELNTVIKIENTASIKAWDGSHRIMYPYFYEAPALTEEGARLGFWALKEALPDYNAEDFRIIDFIRRSYFRPADIGMNGDEGKEFILRYRALLKQWRKLKEEREP
jgi:hypothetical protein